MSFPGHPEPPAQAVPVSAAGDKVFFGLAGTNSTDGQAAIPFLQPDKEAFLEYDVAKLIHTLESPKKPVVGLLSGLPIAAGFDPQTRQMRQPWAVDQQWTQLFEMRTLDPATLKEIDKAIDVLVVVHPKQLGDDAQYAIDQFVLRGGHLLAEPVRSARCQRAYHRDCHRYSVGGRRHRRMGHRRHPRRHRPPAGGTKRPHRHRNVGCSHD